MDDSSFDREIIKRMLASDQEIEVVGEASTGLDALEKTERLNPDIVTMDIDMPIMGGMDAIEQLMNTHALPILVITCMEDADTAFEAVSRGALEVVSKFEIMTQGIDAFCRRIKLLSSVKVVRIFADLLTLGGTLIEGAVIPARGKWGTAIFWTIQTAGLILILL